MAPKPPSATKSATTLSSNDLPIQNQAARSRSFVKPTFRNAPHYSAEPGNSLTDPNFGLISNTLNDGRTFRLRRRFTF